MRLEIGEKGVLSLIFVSLVILFIMAGTAALGTFKIVTLPEWYWPLSLFFLTFAIGVLAPVAGVGGGVIFVPLVSALYPFHIDFVRGTGLIMAYVNAISATAKFIRTGLAPLRIALPAATVTTFTAMLGAMFGLYITRAYPQGKYYVVIALGALLLFIFAIMVTAKRVDFPPPGPEDKLTRALKMRGAYYEASLGKIVEYRASRAALGLLAFAGVGFIAGMFGLGAGWANVPVLNLIMSLPIKVSTSSSILIITLTTPQAAWIYIAEGAVLPLLVVPAVIGMVIGSRLGAIVTVKARPAVVRYIFLAIMLFAAVMNIYRGLHGLGIV